MKEQEIEAGNKLIALFMGLQKHHEFEWYLVPKNSFDTHNWHELKFNTSWSWLMPVVEKIGKMYDPYKYKAYETREAAFDIIDLTIMNPIDEVYDSVVEFIKWYNELNSNPKPSPGLEGGEK